jgi:5'-nucleotidase
MVVYHSRLISARNFPSLYGEPIIPNIYYIEEFFMSNRPLILVTNDDGINSPGLHALALAMADLGDLLIVAPSSQRTSAGRGYPPVVDKAIYPTEIPLGEGFHAAYKADVSPAQAVLVGALSLADRPIDLCVSGINYGENLGTGVTVSGTVGAAIEAACLGIPALAVSLETPKEFHYNHSSMIDFSAAAFFAHYFARRILTRGMMPQVDLLKIDVPATAAAHTPWKASRLSRQRYWEAVNAGYGRLEESVIGYQVNINHGTLERDSDIYAFVNREVSVVPITIDLTAPVTLQDFTDFFDGDNQPV